MLAGLRSRVLSSTLQQPLKLGFPRFLTSGSSSSESSIHLDLQEVEQILNDVQADDIKVIPVNHRCDWTDFMVIATGRSEWHVRNIAQALIYKVKDKQKGFERKLLPSLQGHEGGKWIVVDSGKVIVHALDEKARAYYNLESLWTAKASINGPDQDLEKTIVKIRPKNNSKKPQHEIPPSIKSKKPSQSDLEKTIVKVRPKNNSKKPQHKIPPSNKSKKPSHSVSPS